MIPKSQFLKLLRNLGLIYSLDKVRYNWQKYRNRVINKEFKLQNPDVSLPPDYLIYESFQINYHKYYHGGHESAMWLKDLLSKHVTLENKRILDWGCGPGRIIRHLPGIIANGCEFFGTDYNGQSINWCSTNLQGISFNHNSIDAKLPYDDNFFDIIYGFSIFTHLSESSHYQWLDELLRVLKPGGILLVTTHGDNFKVKLTSTELKSYNEGKLIVRGKVKEGHRTFTAFHPKNFMKNLFKDVIILDHLEIAQTSKTWIPQDTWILRKP